MIPEMAEYILNIDLQLEELNCDWDMLKDKQSGEILKREIERLKQKKINVFKFKHKLNPMTFEHIKPFRTPYGDIVTMKSLLTINGRKYIVTYEDSHRYPVEGLTSMTPEEYQAHTDWINQMSLEE